LAKTWTLLASSPGTIFVYRVNLIYYTLEYVRIFWFGIRYTDMVPGMNLRANHADHDFLNKNYYELSLTPIGWTDEPIQK
jgi:hypothetical protein